MNERLPSYPLFVKDPYFSVWSSEDCLNAGDTVFWTGSPSPMYGVVIADGVVYSFMGKCDGATPLHQTNLFVGAFSTDYTFTCDLFDLRVCFLSPSSLTDPEILARPVCFLCYKVTWKRRVERAQISLMLSRGVLSDTDAPARGGAFSWEDGREIAWFGLSRQAPLSVVGDERKADWGYYYLAGGRAECLDPRTAETKFGIEATGSGEWVFGIAVSDDLAVHCNSASGKFAVAMDDTVSIRYFGEFLKGYYFRDGKTVLDAIREAYAQFDKDSEEMRRFEAAIGEEAAIYGEEYRQMLLSVVRQILGAHKLVADGQGKLLYISKECGSNGCAATVDVSYPSAPFFLLYNPSLVRAMMEPVFAFARKPVWRFPFAPHDLGTYPVCEGQSYGLRHPETGENRHSWEMDWKTGQTFPPFFLFPSGTDVYDETRQMPVEECGNMLILSLAAALMDGDLSQLRANRDLLKKWAEYLLEHGLHPGNQLCTDDFSGRSENNVNLSAKAVIALYAYGRICRLLGDMGETYSETAKRFAKIWVREATVGGHTRRSFGDDGCSFSLKYNMAFDRLFGSDLFSGFDTEAEFNLYLSRAERFGVPLDERDTCTKSDWLMWVCTLTKDVEKRKRLMRKLYDYFASTPDRLPVSDWYDAVTGARRGFCNRSVQGGIFMPLLVDRYKGGFPLTAEQGRKPE